jgi:hypothetical protein
MEILHDPGGLEILREDTWRKQTLQAQEITFGLRESCAFVQIRIGEELKPGGQWSFEIIVGHGIFLPLSFKLDYFQIHPGQKITLLGFET